MSVQPATTPRSSGKIGFVSLGCPKALVDSERILTQLRVEGYELVPSFDAADVVVVNTCGFIDSAVAESLDTIGEAIAENGKVIVTGCLGERAEVIREAHPGVLSISGPQDYASVLGAVHQALPPKHDPFIDLLPRRADSQRRDGNSLGAKQLDIKMLDEQIVNRDEIGIKLTPKHYAYLKISEGCNHRCSFCIIPSMRGNLVSRPIDAVLREAEKLAMGGVRELLVISQDTSAYGVDLKYAQRDWRGRAYQTRMKALCEGLGELGLWTRLHYVYPYPHVDDIIELMTQTHNGTPRLLPYLDIPFQHASPRVLKLMKRPGAIDRTLQRIQNWRAMCPELTIRSTFIVGFPGETDAEFEELLDFLDEAQLDRVGAFAYSPVDGAKANALPDPVDEDVKQERLARFMQRQAGISAARLEAKVGSVQRCIVDAIDGELAIARSMADAPEIDGVVQVQNGQFAGLKPGDFTDVEIMGSDEHDLYGEVAIPD